MGFNSAFKWLNQSSFELIIARDLVIGGSVRVCCNSRLDVGVAGVHISVVCVRKLKVPWLVVRVLEYLGFDRANFCFEVELLFSLKTFQDGVHFLFLLDMEWVFWGSFFVPLF